MKPAKFLVFKVDQQHYVVKNQCVVDVVENSCAYHKSNQLKCGVRFNGKDVNVIDVSKKAESELNQTKAFNSILIVEASIGNSKEFIGLGLDEVVEIITFEELLLNSSIPFSNITQSTQQSTDIIYKNKNAIFLSVEELLRNSISAACLSSKMAFIAN